MVSLKVVHLSEGDLWYPIPTACPVGVCPNRPTAQVDDVNRAWLLTGEMVTTVAADIERLKAEKAVKEQVGGGRLLTRGNGLMI